MIIAFTGMDGSGKTLQAKALSNSLSREGIDSRYVWSRWSPLLVKPAIGLGRLLISRGGASGDEQYQSFRGGKRRMFLRPGLARAWQTLAFLDYSLQVLVKIKLRSRKSRIMVCDRYVYDLLVDLGTNFGYGQEEMPRLFEAALLTLFPKPDLVFLLDLPPEEAFQRKEDVPLSYLRDRRALYLSLGELPGVEILDGTAGIQDLMNTIHRKTLDFLDSRRLGESPKRS
jgi:thymidylate kinase